MLTIEKQFNHYIRQGIGQVLFYRLTKICTIGFSFSCDLNNPNFNNGGKQLVSGNNNFDFQIAFFCFIYNGNFHSTAPSTDLLFNGGKILIHIVRPTYYHFQLDRKNQ